MFANISIPIENNVDKNKNISTSGSPKLFCILEILNEIQTNKLNKRNVVNMDQINPKKNPPILFID